MTGTAPSGAVAAPSTLRRAMGFRTAVSTSTGLAFAALQFLAAASLVTAVAGDSAWISIAVAGGLALVAWSSFGELNGMFPTAAAIRRYMAGAIDDRAALSITFTYLSTIILVVAADAFVVSAALAHVLGVPSGWTAAFTLVLLGLAVASNLRGVKVAGGVQDVATTVVLAATLVVATVALVRSPVPLRGPFAPFHHHSAAGFVESVALGIFLYSAFEWVTTNAEEVRDPRHVHRAMLAAVGILFVVCAVLATALGHVLDHHQLTSAFPQIYLGARAFGVAGTWFMAGVTAVTALNTFNGGFVTASRFVYATAREGSLPPLLARLNDRAVPWVPVVGLGAVSLAVSVVVEAVGGTAWQVLVAVGAALEAGIYAVAAFCVLRHRRRLADHPRPFRIPAVGLVAGAGVVVFGIMALVASVSVGNRVNPAPLVIILVMGAAATAYVLREVPRLRAAEEARRAARPRRRPPRPTGSGAVEGDDGGVADTTRTGSAGGPAADPPPAAVP